MLQTLLLCAPLVCVGRFYRVWQDPAFAMIACLATALLFGDSLSMFLGAVDGTPKTGVDRRHARLALATGMTLLLTLWISISERGMQPTCQFGCTHLAAATVAAL